MPAALALPISGPYVGTWNAQPLGIQNDDGYELVCTIQGQEMNETDAFGMTLVEAVYRGLNWRARFRGMEWNRTGLMVLLQQFGFVGAAGAFQPTLQNVGARWSAFCQTLLLTAILANPPSFPQTVTALLAGLAPQMQSNFFLTSKVREMPLELVLLPYSAVIGSITANVPFTTT